jgi:uncharacterized protein
MHHQIYINLVVKDLNQAQAFWAALGFTFNPQFTDKTAACLMLDETIYAMLMLPETMRRFTKKEIVDATKATEVINALTFGSQQDVDAVMEKALQAGATEYREKEILKNGEETWMYGRSFEDIDGHLWEAVFMKARINRRLS